MFRSFKKRSPPAPEPPPLRPSPSLPGLSATGLQWPADLVDPADLRSESPEPQATDAPKPSLLASPAKTSIGGAAPVPWHKPFRAMSTDSHGDSEHTISRLYERERAPEFEARPAPESTPPVAAARPRRPVRVSPQFNLMVAGAQGTGKTTFIRLLLATSDLASPPTPELRAFLRSAAPPTTERQTLSVELAEARFERLALRVTDTPGLDMRPERELVRERQLNALVTDLEQRFRETMEEESKVVRPTAGAKDAQIHLLIYMIDPASLVGRRARARTAQLQQHAPGMKSDATVGARAAAADAGDGAKTPSLTPDSSDGFESDEDEEEELTMAPADLRALERLAQRANVLPVLARADSLSEAQLARAKDAVRAELARAELSFGLLANGGRSAKSSAEPEPQADADTSVDGEAAPRGRGRSGTNGSARESAEENQESALDDGDEERPSRPVIKLRTSRRASSSARVARSRSRSRLRAGSGGERSPVRIDGSETDSVPVARFDAARLAERNLMRLLPFALVMPERMRRPGYGYVGDASRKSVSGHGHEGSQAEAQSPAVGPGASTPEPLRGVFTRAFRWGTVDVLDPAHCDFAALRVAVLSTHMKMFKTHTREVLYERFRTEKLLVRRATQKIGEKEAKRLYENLGL